MAETASAESKKDFGEGSTGSVGLWLAEIKAYDKTFDGWLTRAEAVVKRYRNETSTAANDGIRPTPNKFNILWSNTQTLQPAIYSRMPKPDISRTHKDRNPVARAAAVILERATRDQIKAGGFHTTMLAARDDYLLTARGQAWVRYVPTYGEETRDKIFLQADTAEDGTTTYTKPDGTPAEFSEGETPQMDAGRPYVEEGEPYKPVVSECVKQEHIGWRDFGHTPAPNWGRVRAVWKREYMTRDQLVERFGKEKGDKISLAKVVPNVDKADEENYGDAFKRGEIYEIWDKSSKKVLWISSGYSEGPLDEIDDPLHLEGFFPCPEPIYGTRTTDSLVPVTDYDEYKSQAEEIDQLTQRISILTKALKVAGAYNSAFTDLGKILDGAENNLVGVDNWAMFAEAGGIQGAISFVPIKEIADTIVALTNIRAQAKRDLYEITGISDIVRGQSDPSETLGAQEIKRQFVGMRIEDRKLAFARFARDTVQISAEIIAEHFSPETLWDISGWEHSDEARALDRAAAQWQEMAQAQQAQAMQSGMGPPQMPQGVPPAPGMTPGGPEGMPPQQAVPQAPLGERPPTSREAFDAAVELLRSDRLRGYTIDIETDSMVLEDQQAEKQSAIELVTSVTGYLKEAVPAAQMYPEIAPILSELLLFSLRRFKTGQSLEAAFEQVSDGMIESAQQPKPDQNAPKPPSVSIPYADAPPEAQTQMLAQAGIKVDPQTLADHAATVAAQNAPPVVPSAPPPPDTSAADLAKINNDHALAMRKLDLEDLKIAIEDRRLAMLESQSAAETAQTQQKVDAETRPAQDLTALVQIAMQTAEQSRQQQEAFMQTMLQAMQVMMADKQIVRDAEGKIVGARSVGVGTLQ